MSREGQRAVGGGELQHRLLQWQLFLVPLGVRRLESHLFQTWEYSLSNVMGWRSRCNLPLLPTAGTSPVVRVFARSPTAFRAFMLVL